MRHYDHTKPADVREFSNKIARLMNSGPAGKIAAKRLLDDYSKSHAGQELLKSMRQRTKILAEGPGVDLKNVRVHGASASEEAKQLGARAFSSGSDACFSQGQAPLELIAEEVAHTLQQTKRD